MVKNKKLVIISGCSSGIGLECAKYLQSEFEVIATARKAQDVEMLRSLGFEAYILDISDFFAIDNFFNMFKTQNREIFALFNNAGFGQPGAVEDLPMQALKEQFETNFFGLVKMTQNAVQIMRKQNQGIIIQHSSVLGLISLRYRGAYNASKYAIEGISDTLRLELDNTNIKIVTLNTGPIASNFRHNAMKKFVEFIDTQASYHSEVYKQKVQARLDTKDDSFFTKPSSLVASYVYKILTSKNPKPRYKITFATKLLAFLKRILRTKTLDMLLIKVD